MSGGEDEEGDDWADVGERSSGVESVLVSRLESSGRFTAPICGVDI